MAESSTLTCLRVGFTGEPEDTPEDALTQLLRRVEGNGYQIVSVSVLQPESWLNARERYEAYIVMRATMSPVAAGKPLMRCFTDEELSRGIIAVIQGWNRCTVCGDENNDPHDAHPHPFAAADPLNLFLEAARRDDDRAEKAYGTRHTA